MSPFSLSAPFVPTAQSQVLKLAGGALQAIPLPLLFLLNLLFCLLIGWLDYATGWEFSLFIFYALPIVIAGWRLGSLAGLATAAFCGVVWLVANRVGSPYETNLGYVWAMLSRFFYFSVVVFAVMSVRRKQEADGERIRMLEEQRQLELDIVSVSEHEQRRIGQDLHDGLCQELAAIGCAARALADDLAVHHNDMASDALMIEEAIRHAIIEARDLARGIFPVHVDRTGLSASLTDLAEKMSRLTGTSVKVAGGVDLLIDSPVISMNLYRIAQEAVSNALRHSEATDITITLRPITDGIELRIEDNGRGLPSDARSTSAGMGLRTMNYRARVLGGTLELGTNTRGGTSVSCCIHPSPPIT